MTGANPNTAWLKGCVALDSDGFIKTGADLAADELESARWPPGRRPYVFETSVPGRVRCGRHPFGQRKARRVSRRRRFGRGSTRAPVPGGLMADVGRAVSEHFQG